MEIIIGIIVILVAIAFWKRLLAGIILGLILGFIGLFFGSTGMWIGFTLGFIAGISSSQEDLDEWSYDTYSEEEEYEEEEETTYKNPHKSNFNNNHEAKIIRCRSCQKKIRIRLPLQGNRGRCPACSSSFNIEIDAYGNLKVEAASENYPGPATVSDHFKILGLESTATPDEVRSAYKKKIREYHPDRLSGTGLGEKFEKLANEESKAINTAYSTLKSKGLAS